MQAFVGTRNKKAYTVSDLGNFQSIRGANEQIGRMVSWVCNKKEYKRRTVNSVGE